MVKHWEEQLGSGLPPCRRSWSDGPRSRPCFSRKLLGKIRLEPIKPDVGRPYLRTSSQLQTLALSKIDLDAKEGERGLTAPDAGSTALHGGGGGSRPPSPNS